MAPPPPHRHRAEAEEGEEARTSRRVIDDPIATAMNHENQRRRRVGFRSPEIERLIELLLAPRPAPRAPNNNFQSLSASRGSV